MPYKDPNDPRKKEQQRRANAKYRAANLEKVRAMRDQQQGRCAICETTMRIGGKPGMDQEHVDHDHTTGEVRGLLCSRCNTSIGKFNDDPALLRRAADYIEGRYNMPGGM